MAFIDHESPSSDLLYAQHTSEYAYRIPTPPRILVPPPELTANFFPEAASRPLQEYGLAKNTRLFQSPTHFNTPRGLGWTYGRRRQAQAILPFLYLGPMVAAKDGESLKKEGISMLLSIRHKHSLESRFISGALRVADELGIQRTTLDIANNQELISAFPIATRMINEHRAHIDKLQQSYQGDAPVMGKVMVFCESGNERSAAVVAAYLMEVHDDVDYIEAMQICQAQRFCVNFDEAMKHLLQNYWDILQAKRMVTEGGHAEITHEALVSSHPTSDADSCNRLKRPLELDDDDDDDDEQHRGGSDEARFEGRSFAPFTDA
ncbi:hypothetical protein B0A49_00803 [Cryomyces minteri]|uniref:Tyrosine specific protein phosphatases domain-containing protein n=1 Tax=Cryomyces minteri TaxID=331657 RepID=A0A4U0XSH0_9PEZI|nr:hypothetical protein B0A49_00803 [Cryomyces minteri]